MDEQVAEIQEQNTPATLTEDSVKAMIADAVKATEKTWQSRFDQKNTELQKLKAEKMTAEERLQYDLAEKEKALETEKSAFRTERIKADRLTAASAVGLPSNFAAFLTGEDAEGIEKSATDLKKAIDALVSEKVKLQVYGGVLPTSGDTDLSALDDETYMAQRAKQIATKGRF